MRCNKVRSVLLVLIFIFIVFSTVAGAEGISVNTEEVGISDITESEVVNSTLVPYRSVMVSSSTGGIIDRLNIEIGQYVSEEEELLVFETDQLTEQVKQAEAALEIAEANYTMAEEGAVEEDIRSAESSYEQAVASLEGAQKTVELLETTYNNRTSYKQQVISAESQFKSAQKQVELAVEGVNQAEAGLKQAEAGLEQAQKEYDRTSYLYEEGVATQSQYDMVKSQLDNAEASVDNARSAVENAKLSRKQAEISLQAAEESYELARDNYADPVELEQQLKNARTQVKVANSNKEVAKANMEKVKKGAREEEIAVSRANVKQAESGLESARLSLEDAYITSPISGVIADVSSEESEMVNPGTPICTVVNIDKMYVEAFVSASTLTTLNSGDKVDVEILAYDDFIKEGEIKNISPVADPQRQAYKIRILLENDDRKLRGGMFANLHLITGRAEDTVVVPQNAILELDEDPFIFVVEDGRAYRKEIETGIIGKNYVEIVDGVTAGQEVIINGQHNIQNGDRVEVVD